MEQVVREDGFEDHVAARVVPIKTEDDANAQRFLGSPTVRIDGRDLEPAAESLSSFGLQCRLYSNEGRLEGVPPMNWIRKALGVPEVASTIPEARCCEGGS